MKYAINIILVLWTTVGFCQADPLITPQLRHEVKRKILKLKFANKALYFMQNAVGERGEFTGNKKRLSKREYIYRGSQFKSEIGFGYGYAEDLSISFEPFDWAYPDTSWHLYKVKFSIKPELDFIRGIFQDIDNTVRKDRFVVIAINQEQKIRFLSHELKDKENMNEFVPAFDKNDPEAYISWVEFCVKFYDGQEDFENITYLKEAEGKYWYNIVYPDSMNFQKVECSIPVGFPEEIRTIYYANENFVYPEKFYTNGFKNKKIKDRFIKDNLMKNIFAYKVAEAMSPLALEEAIDNYFSSDDSILDHLIPDFDDVFYFDMFVNRRFTGELGVGSGHAYDVFVPECKVLKKVDDREKTGSPATQFYYQGLFPDKEYPYDYYSMDDDNCLDWSVNGYPARFKKAEEDSRQEYKEGEKAWANSKVVQDYKKKMENWPTDKPEPSPPPPPPPPAPHAEVDNFQPTIYKADTYEKLYPNKERYTVAINIRKHDVIFLSGENIFLDPFFGYKFGHSNKKHGISDRCCEDERLFKDKETSEKYWKEYAAIRLMSYSSPNLYIVSIPPSPSTPPPQKLLP